MEALRPCEHSLGLAAALFFTYFVLLQIRERMIWSLRTRGRPLPPGPRPLPIIGNLLDMPSLRQWLGFRDLCSKHGAYISHSCNLYAEKITGEIVYLDILGKPVLIVGSVRAATEILEKRSANTSDRTPSHLLPL